MIPSWLPSTTVLLSLEKAIAVTSPPVVSESKLWESYHPRTLEMKTQSSNICFIVYQIYYLLSIINLKIKIKVKDLN